MKILVTGGSGFLGTHVRRFFDADDFSRRSGLDILNLNDVWRIANYDVVIHLAAHLDKSPEATEQSFLTNVEGTVNVLRAMKPDAVFIFASTKDVYGSFAEDLLVVPESCPANYNGQSALEWSKLIAERYVEFYAAQIGFRSCIFRLSTVYAPMTDGNEPNFVTNYVEAVKFGDVMRLPADGAPRRDLLYVDDFSDACRAFVESKVRNSLYNLGGGSENACTLRELIVTIENLMNASAVISGESPPAPVPMNYVSDLSKIQRELGWSPRISIEDGLRNLL
ncbi:MAG: NAD(P)-dependent oxidoreductase [Pyrinomonadaceae bacterium]|nr:NAD(P)-dependent oxidoreductase [Pyrinomonadaceae bacterium]